MSTQLRAARQGLADGSHDLHYLSIQAAVDAAASGNVIEAVDLTAKDVRLLARRASRDETVIAPTSGARAVLLGVRRDRLHIAQNSWRPRRSSAPFSSRAKQWRCD